MPSLISVVIPAYNAEVFIGQTIQSVLDQTYPWHEIIVVDDGSTDSTKEALKRFEGRIRYLHQQNKGPSAARNTGIQSAKGDFICFLDADDLWIPEKLEVQLAFMEANPDIALVCSDYEEFNEEAIVLSSFLAEKHHMFPTCPIVAGPLDNAFEKLVFENFVGTPTVMLRKSCLEKAGVFDEEIRSVEDRDLWLRISAWYRIACIPQIFCKKRVHQMNVSKQTELALRGKIRVLEKNWKLFPQLVPDRMWRTHLAEAYCQLGYHLLEKNQRKAALKAGMLSLKHMVFRSHRDTSLKLTPWWMSVGLIPAALLGWKLSRSLWQPLKELK
ncbi:MAG: glycosyltransferase family 2 protein [Nitrospira sp.]|nr:glycosyltransferase family 2 protein [Nitrospira sp.]